MGAKPLRISKAMILVELRRNGKSSEASPPSHFNNKSLADLDLNICAQLKLIEKAAIVALITSNHAGATRIAEVKASYNSFIQSQRRSVKNYVDLQPWLEIGSAR